MLIHSPPCTCLLKRISESPFINLLWNLRIWRLMHFLIPFMKVMGYFCKDETSTKICRDLLILLGFSSLHLFFSILGARGPFETSSNFSNILPVYNLLQTNNSEINAHSKIVLFLKSFNFSKTISLIPECIMYVPNLICHT